MKYLLIAYVALVALALALKPAPASTGPECGAGVLCIRTQKQVQAALEQTPAFIRHQR
jgi:hypothetical protein